MELKSFACTRSLAGSSVFAKTSSALTAKIVSAGISPASGDISIGLVAKDIALDSVYTLHVSEMFIRAQSALLVACIDRRFRKVLCVFFILFFSHGLCISIECSTCFAIGTQQEGGNKQALEKNVCNHACIHLR